MRLNRTSVEASVSVAAQRYNRPKQAHPEARDGSRVTARASAVSRRARSLCFETVGSSSFDKVCVASHGSVPSASHAAGFVGFRRKDALKHDDARVTNEPSGLFSRVKDPKETETERAPALSAEYSPQLEHASPSISAAATHAVARSNQALCLCGARWTPVAYARVAARHDAMALAFAVDARAGADREESQAGIRRRAMTRYASPDRFAIARSGGFDTPLAAFALATARAAAIAARAGAPCLAASLARAVSASASPSAGAGWFGACVSASA
mmetsp:Transcript_7958/g.29793  ORF Transcript_7958/g.29793 Transcript_7958/m.29793 type:complete len:271 (-) Transcript_7958:2995-3807(-)